MKNNIKQIIKSSLLGGLIFASIMALDNYYGGQEFEIWKFLKNILIFGIVTGLLNYYNQKQLKKEIKN
jgi:hypothetical protein